MLRKLSLFDMLRILLTGSSYIGNYKNKGWNDSLPFYAFKCPKHGIIINHIKGYNKRLECPKCSIEMKKENTSKQIPITQ